MKPLLLIGIVISFCSLNTEAQSVLANTQDSLTWYIYIPGRPDMRWVEAKKSVAKEWGIKTDVFYGDCVGTFDFKAAEFEEKNQPLFKDMLVKYGIDWKEKFNNQLTETLKMLDSIDK